MTRLLSLLKRPLILSIASAVVYFIASPRVATIFIDRLMDSLLDFVDKSTVFS
jgi:hypothetical protein